MLVIIVVLDVAEHGVDLPPVAGRVGHPDLVLVGVAAGGVPLVEGDQAALPETLLAPSTSFVVPTRMPRCESAGRSACCKARATGGSVSSNLA